MPALEAMACGCPLAVSRVGPLPELCGDAAVYFDPASVEDIARGIDDVLSGPPGAASSAPRSTAGTSAHAGTTTCTASSRPARLRATADYATKPR